ncbi:class I glutamine amidotransferase-like protein [Acrodontium crateriforme]|uniref:Class I glutamine amidotransferase-like protein n=1 Tax=Acrodontium crateriforme TaxID=150365 RepID=A0AAQ3RAM7_9PEZI|nr:class I glutamine amidotransferase-like protein [Acrodontium crateriforme]
MRPPLRIAILECDSPLGRTKEKYGGYGPLFKELLNKGVKQVVEHDGVDGVNVPELEIGWFDVVGQSDMYPDLEAWDAVLISGSKFNSYDNDAWILKLVEFTKKVLKQNRVRLIGVCFGHQIIGRALNVKVGRSDQGWEIAVTPIQLTPRGKEIFRLEELAIHQMHRDIVFEYPESVEALGHSDRCAVQGMYAKNRLITVQGHPEFTGIIVDELLDVRHDMGIFNDELYKSGKSRVMNHHDGVAISAAFIRFLLDE